jgi:hypothetical protein
VSEESLLYLKRAGRLVNDASVYVEQSSKTAPAADEDLRESILRELLGIKVLLLAINRQLSQVAATVTRSEPETNGR